MWSCWLMHTGAAAQDIHFSQFFEAPLWRNPSLAGIFTGDVRVQAVYRDQWNSFTDAYKTTSLNAELKMPVGKGYDFVTAGLQVLYDKAGTTSWVSAHVLPALNYHKAVSTERNQYLSLGFMGGYVQRNFDASKATTNSTYDNGTPGENFNGARYGYLDGSVGMSFNSDFALNSPNNYYIGAAYHHFAKPRGGFYANGQSIVPGKWVFSGGMKFGVSEYAFMTIQADQSFQGSFSETVGGAMYGLKLGDDPDNPRYIVNAGAFLRWNDALIPVVKLDYHPFAVSLSYDVNISKLKPSSYGRGGFELSVSYTGFRKKTEEWLLCPKF